MWARVARPADGVLITSRPRASPSRSRSRAAYGKSARAAARLGNWGGAPDPPPGPLEQVSVNARLQRGGDRPAPAPHRIAPGRPAVGAIGPPRRDPRAADEAHPPVDDDQLPVRAVVVS